MHSLYLWGFLSAPAAGSTELPLRQAVSTEGGVGLGTWGGVSTRLWAPGGCGFRHGRGVG